MSKLSPLNKGDPDFLTLESLNISKPDELIVRAELLKWLRGYNDGCDQHKDDPCCCVFDDGTAIFFIKRFLDI